MRKSISYLVTIISTVLIVYGLFSCNMDVGVKTPENETKATGKITGKVMYSNVEGDNHNGIILTLDKTDGLVTQNVMNVMQGRVQTADIFQNGDSNARVIVANNVTSSDGSYTFENLAEGTYTVYAASSYSSERAVCTNVVVRAAETSVADILRLTAAGSITGRITLDNGTSGNTGFLVFVAGTSYMAMTDDAGNYTISGVPAGSGYQVVATKNGVIHNLSSNVTVTANGSAALADNNFTSSEIDNTVQGEKGEQGIQGETGEKGETGAAGVDGKDGISIVWLGTFDSVDEIENPEYLNAYFNMTDGCSYIFNGNEWQLLARSGTNGADGNGNSANYVTAKATDKGIEFSGLLLDTSFIKDRGGWSETFNYSVSVTDTENDITMTKILESSALSWYDSVTYQWIITYPFVDKGKEYTFTVKHHCNNYIFYEEKLTVTATGGLGEYKIENIEEYEVELTEDKTVQLTQKPEFTKNDKVNIKRQAVYYELYTYKEKPESFWDGLWLWNSTIYGDSTSVSLKDSLYWTGWRSYNDINYYLSGHWYGIRSRTRIEIAGYSSDDSIYFEMNDTKETYGEWGGKKNNVLVVYGYQLDGKESFEDFVINGADGKKLEVTGLPGSKIGDYEYAEVYDVIDIIYEPTELPQVNVTGYKENYHFKRWSWTYPRTQVGQYNGNHEIINGEDYSVDYVYAIFSPVFDVNVYFMMNDGTEDVYMTKTINPSSMGGWSKWNDIRNLANGSWSESIYKPTREGYKFTGWYMDKDGKESIPYTVDIAPEDDVVLYAGWEKILTAYLHDGNGVIGTEEFVASQYELKTIPKKDGYIFTGWYFDKECTEPLYTYNLDSDIMVYAGWNKEITVKLMDGENELKTVKSYVGDYVSDGKFTAPEKEGYYFKGYFSTPDFSKSISVITENTSVIYLYYRAVGESTIIYTNDNYQKYDTIYFKDIGINKQNVSDYKLVISYTYDKEYESWAGGAIVDENWTVIISLIANSSGVQEVEISDIYAKNSTCIRLNIWSDWYTVTKIEIIEKEVDFFTSPPVIPNPSGLNLIFDPATYTGDIGKVVEIDGEAYLRLTVDGYNTSLNIEPIDLSLNETFYGTIFGEYVDSTLSPCIELRDSDWNSISYLPGYTYCLTDYPITLSAGVAEEESWRTISESKKCSIIQIYVQSTSDWQAQSDITVYLGKIYAE